MTSSNKTPGNPTDLPELLADYLRRQVAAHEAGLALPSADGEVLPYEAGPAQPVEPRTAWDEAVAVLRFSPAAAVKSVKVPPEWGQVVAAQESLTALPFCAGNYPQMVRDVHALMRGADLQRTAEPSRPIAVEALEDWARSTVRSDDWPRVLLAIGALRLARQFEQAADLLRSRQTDVPAEWQSAWANEEASLAWHRGDRTAAAVAWQTQPESVPVLFNRGMAALFLGQPRDARVPLRQAAEKLPESGAWHHLARLYLALAEMRESLGNLPSHHPAGRRVRANAATCLHNPHLESPVLQELTPPARHFQLTQAQKSLAVIAAMSYKRMKI